MNMLNYGTVIIISSFNVLFVQIIVFLARCSPQILNQKISIGAEEKVILPGNYEKKYVNASWTFKKNSTSENESMIFDLRTNYTDSGSGYKVHCSSRLKICDLEIKRTSQEHVGTFYFRADDLVVLNLYTLLVRDKNSSSGPENQLVLLGNDLILKCPIGCKRLVLWAYVPYYSQDFVHLSTNKTIDRYFERCGNVWNVSNVDYSHAGMYFCYGPSSNVYTANVIILDEQINCNTIYRSDLIKESVENKIFARQNEDVAINCSVSYRAHDYCRMVPTWHDLKRNRYFSESDDVMGVGIEKKHLWLTFQQNAFINSTLSLSVGFNCNDFLRKTAAAADSHDNSKLAKVCNAGNIPSYETGLKFTFREDGTGQASVPNKNQKSSTIVIGVLGAILFLLITAVIVVYSYLKATGTQEKPPVTSGKATSVPQSNARYENGEYNGFPPTPMYHTISDYLELVYDKNGQHDPDIYEEIGEVDIDSRYKSLEDASNQITNVYKSLETSVYYTNQDQVTNVQPMETTENI